MDQAATRIGLAASSKRFARLLTIGENRLGPLTVEVQAERERFLHAVLLALSVASSRSAPGITLTAALCKVGRMLRLHPLSAVYGYYGREPAFRFIHRGDSVRDGLRNPDGQIIREGHRAANARVANVSAFATLRLAIWNYATCVTL